jgi:hypothetical protein
VVGAAVSAHLTNRVREHRRMAQDTCKRLSWPRRGAGAYLAFGRWVLADGRAFRVCRLLSSVGTRCWGRWARPGATLDVMAEKRSHAELDAVIRRQAERSAFGAILAAEGVRTVGLDEQGAIIWVEPEGGAAPAAR